MLFFLLYGKWLKDTQTGLRAFRKEDLQFMIDVEGERFEYEMNVLIACVRQKLPIISLTIETIYENENRGTHYHPFRDSMRIFRVIVKGFVKFMGVSLLCLLVDQGLFNLLNLAVFRNGAVNEANYILLSTVIARAVSGTMNFLLNKNVVFGQRGETGSSLWKYVTLCIGIMLCSAAGVWLLGKLGMSSTAAKLIVDFLLYFVSYWMQQKWVFSKSEVQKR